MDNLIKPQSTIKSILVGLLFAIIISGILYLIELLFPRVFYNIDYFIYDIGWPISMIGYFIFLFWITGNLVLQSIGVHNEISE